MRRDVIERVKVRLAELKPALPAGVEIVPTYDRSSLIDRAIATLKRSLVEEGITVSVVIVLFLLHFRSALLPIVSLPIAGRLERIYKRAADAEAGGDAHDGKRLAR